MLPSINVKLLIYDPSINIVILLLSADTETLDFQPVYFIEISVLQSHHLGQERVMVSSFGQNVNMFIRVVSPTCS